MSVETTVLPVVNELPKFGKLMLECVTCTESSNGGFILKLVNENTKKEKTPFGMKSVTKKLTFYMKVDDKVALKKKAEMNLDDFKITEAPFAIPETDENGVENDNAGEVIMIKWITFNM